MATTTGASGFTIDLGFERLLPVPFGLDDALFGVAINLVSSALWDLVHDPLYEEEYQPQDRGSQAYTRAIASAVGELATPLADIHPADHVDVGDFIGSDEVRRLVLQLYRTRVTQSTTSLTTLRRGLGELWAARHPGRAPAIDLDRVLDALVAGCDAVLESAVRRESIAAHEALSAARFALLNERLSGIDHQLNLLADDRAKALVDPAPVPRLPTTRPPEASLTAAADAFERQFRAAVMNHLDRVRLTGIGDFREAPIDDVYVPPPFDLESRTRPTLYEQLAGETFRVVVLGAPGAGKSLLAQKLCLDLARGSTTISGGLHPTGLLVPLRTVGQWNLRDAIEQILHRTYQLHPEPELVEYMLVAGRMALVFDGLDELPLAEDRSRARDDLQALAASYPQVPIIVTSRIVGYDHAALDERRYRLAYLGQYGVGQVTEFARRWFQLVHHDEPARADAVARAFLRETESVSDLRVNPLLLQLLCTLYRREGHISRFRTDIYERSATLLFDTWDASRGIGERQMALRPAVASLAWRMLSDPTLAAGVGHQRAAAELTDYLYRYRNLKHEDAYEAAISLLEFSTQRAWVFSEVGMDATGASVYQFTHRTFLEFFAAEHIAKGTNDPAELAAHILDRLVAGDQTVPKLALDLFERRVVDGTRETIAALQHAATTPEAQAAVAAFAAEIGDDRVVDR